MKKGAALGKKGRHYEAIVRVRGAKEVRREQGERVQIYAFSSCYRIAFSCSFRKCHKRR